MAVYGSALFLWLIGSILLLAAQPAAAQSKNRMMPTASLPIEPASADPEVIDDRNPDRAPVEAKSMAPIRNRAFRSSEARDLGAQLGILMSRDGFGAQLHLLQYSLSWLAVSQALRYQSQDKSADPLFDSSYGMMLGLELHPWRSARFSPVLNLHMGGDRYLRGADRSDLNLFGAEAVAGVELRLAKAASFLFQWSERYYPELQEQLFVDQLPGEKYAGSFQVFFNLRWEAAM